MYLNPPRLDSIVADKEFHAAFPAPVEVNRNEVENA